MDNIGYVTDVESFLLFGGILFAALVIVVVGTWLVECIFRDKE